MDAQQLSSGRAEAIHKGANKSFRTPLKAKIKIGAAMLFLYFASKLIAEPIFNQAYAQKKGAKQEQPQQLADSTAIQGFASADSLAITGLASKIAGKDLVYQFSVSHKLGRIDETSGLINLAGKVKINEFAVQSMTDPSQVRVVKVRWHGEDFYMFYDKEKTAIHVFKTRASPVSTIGSSKNAQI
ncbi:MAG: hypothetical protein NTX79_02025 [Candidatus Micrarchaeota archaeon]|nr:hypothetical protein [Candidatus Micrarchaeota archaeon]